jgi:hypothetical protein
MKTRQRPGTPNAAIFSPDSHASLLPLRSHQPLRLKHLCLPQLHHCLLRSHPFPGQMSLPLSSLLMAQILPFFLDRFGGGRPSFVNPTSAGVRL